MFGINHWEMMLVFVIALLLFGKNLPQVARSLGKGMMEFKKGLHGMEDEMYSSASARQPTAPQSRPMPIEEREETTAPKFEPPKFEPTEAPAEKPA
ncbi:MAG: twin-arginine translocase TatA/TatE family subunit [Planctomycetales bacterium]